MNKLFILFLFALTSLSLMAQSVKADIGVLGFTSYNVAESDLLTVEEIFTSELVFYNKFNVVDRKSIENKLLENDLEIKGCLYSSCAVETGQILDLDYVVYGSLNRLEESLIITVYMVNIETALVEGSSREKFYTIEQALLAMPVLIGKLIEGNSYNGPSFDPSELLNKNVKNEDKQASDKFIELGIGYETTVYENGIEIETSYRQMLGSTFGLGAGILLGYGSGMLTTSVDNLKEPGIRFGLNLNLYIQVNKLIGVAVGFRGLPEYIGYFGGPSIAIYYGPWYVRLGHDIVELFMGRGVGSGYNADIGYSFKL